MKAEEFTRHTISLPKALAERMQKEAAGQLSFAELARSRIEQSYQAQEVTRDELTQQVAQLVGEMAEVKATMTQVVNWLEGLVKAMAPEKPAPPPEPKIASYAELYHAPEAEVVSEVPPEVVEPPKKRSWWGG